MFNYSITESITIWFITFLIKAFVVFQIFIANSWLPPSHKPYFILYQFPLFSLLNMFQLLSPCSFFFWASAHAVNHDLFSSDSFQIFLRSSTYVSRSQKSFSNLPDFPPFPPFLPICLPQQIMAAIDLHPFIIFHPLEHWKFYEAKDSICHDHSYIPGPKNSTWQMGVQWIFVKLVNKWKHLNTSRLSIGLENRW